MKSHWISCSLGVFGGVLGNILLGHEWYVIAPATLVVVAIAVVWGYDLKRVLK